MKIHNRLPLLLDCLRRWERCPSAEQFHRGYAQPMEEIVGDFFEDFRGELKALDWAAYRAEALRLDPEREEARLRGNLTAVQDLFGFPLSGEIILMGAFAAMDGYARFDRGTHRVYLGADESHARGRYFDILTVHELTHVARESREEVWLGFGLDPRMTQAQFTENQPVIEHLMGEGFSCAVSEILVPGQPAWEYAYQTEESLAQVLARAPAIDRAIRKELTHPDGDYGRLYRIKPLFAHYVWAWQWSKRILGAHARGLPRELVSLCSKEFVADALEFELKGV